MGVIYFLAQSLTTLPGESHRLSHTHHTCMWVEWLTSLCLHNETQPLQSAPVNRSVPVGSVMRGSMAPVRLGRSVALIPVCRGGHNTTIDSTCYSCEPRPIVYDINNLFFCSREQPTVSSPHLSLSRYVFCLIVVLSLVRLCHIYAALINNCLSGLVLIWQLPVTGTNSTVIYQLWFVVSVPVCTINTCMYTLTYTHTYIHTTHTPQTHTQLHILFYYVAPGCH